MRNIIEYLIVIVLLAAVVIVPAHVMAGEKHSNPPTPPPTVTPPPTTTQNSTALELPSNSTYGLLALATSGNQLDWGVPDKLQVSVAGAFTEGGNQAIAFGVGTRVGGILINGHFATTINAPDHHDDYAFVVGGTMHF